MVEVSRYTSHKTYIIPGSWEYREWGYRVSLMKILSLKINERE